MTTPQVGLTDKLGPQEHCTDQLWRPLRSLSPDEVQQFLHHFQFPRYLLRLLAEEGADGDYLSGVESTNELQEVGVKVLQARKLLAKIEKARARGVPICSLSNSSRPEGSLMASSKPDEETNIATALQVSHGTHPMAEGQPRSVDDSEAREQQDTASGEDIVAVQSNDAAGDEVADGAKNIVVMEAIHNNDMPSSASAAVEIQHSSSQYSGTESVRQLASLTEDEVQLLLRFWRMPENAVQSFSRSAVNGAMLSTFTSTDSLLELGIGVLQARRLMLKIQDMRDDGVPVSWLAHAPVSGREVSPTDMWQQGSPDELEEEMSNLSGLLEEMYSSNTVLALSEAGDIADDNTVPRDIEQRERSEEEDADTITKNAVSTGVIDNNNDDVPVQSSVELSARNRPLSSLTVDDVQQLLVRLGMPVPVLRLFALHSVDGELLCVIQSASEMTEFGVNDLLASRLLLKVSELRDDGVPSSWFLGSPTEQTFTTQASPPLQRSTNSNKSPVPWPDEEDMPELRGPVLHYGEPDDTRPVEFVSDTRSLESLSVSEVSQLLRHLRISEVVQTLFANERVDGRALQKVDDKDDFVAVGINTLHSLMRVVNDAQQNGVPVSWLRGEDGPEVPQVGPPAQPPAVSHAPNPADIPVAALPTPASNAADWTQAYDRYYRAWHLSDAASDAWLEQQSAAGNEAAKAYLMVRIRRNDKFRASFLQSELQWEALPRWLQSRDATEQMHAQFITGYCYAWGLGYSQDVAQAITWYRRSADHGHADAQNMLGNSYHDGRGVNQDHEQAVSWYRKAADQGHAEAQCNLADCYLNGVGVTADRDEAIRWYRRSAAQGYSGAISALNGMKVSLE